MKKRTLFVCESCGAQFFQWHGQCPNCKEWGKLKEKELLDTKEKRQKKAPAFYSLPSIQTEKDIFLSSGSKIIDSFLGQGLVLGSVILLGGEPGIGKSTFLLQLMSGFCKNNKKALYISGEESLEQIKLRASRLNINTKNIYLSKANLLEDVLNLIENFQEGSFVAIDSVQTLIDEGVEGVAGSVSQVKSVSSKLIEITKRKNIITVLVSHVTKEGQIAGPKLMEHMVDVVLYLEGDKQYNFRILKALKNRYGSSNNILVLTMTEKGLKIVEDPTTFFLKARDPFSAGSAIVMTAEGQWAFAIEVQALVIKSSLSFPRRVSLGFDINRLHLILAVLEKKMALIFSDKDVYVKIGAGLRPNDPGLDLGITAAILSSYFEKPLPEKGIFWGEIDLNGQVRPTLKEDLRLFSAKNLGYSPIVHPALDEDAKKAKNSNEICISHVSELMDFLKK